jgi:hypothetical protein
MFEGVGSTGSGTGLIPVGTAIIIVADVKYARVSTSIPTVNIW